MLQLRKICKQYQVVEITQNVLKGISINLRDAEFVSILGPSGSGKTTLLNIIGGLDRYDSGDLIINGVSTSKFAVSDWDYYRNNSIGFVFQSYNLIPHQTVLSNVEMALTLAGVSKKERHERAVEVLTKVGLKEHMHKKPNQMSGGQMQRVAIARALINNPDILLADEPTGALDSETSIQIMELLKEIANDKLVIMVTHNPELAQQYSTRIIKLTDGNITSDTDEYIPQESIQQNTKRNKISMSFLTALSLSFNNLKTKKARTLLTAFAGSIGIIGIALVLSLSQGVTDYIASIQKETMSSYPITITSESVDMTGMMGMRQEIVGGMLDKATEASTQSSVVTADYESLKMESSFLSNIKENNLTAFKRYLDNPSSEINQYLGENGVIYSYDISYDVFSYDSQGNFINCNTELNEESSTPFSMGLSGLSNGIAGRLNNIKSMLSGDTTASSNTNFSELPKGAGNNAVSEKVLENYEILQGKWPDSYDEAVIVLSSDNGMSAKALCQLGYITKEAYELNKSKAENNENIVDTTFNYTDMLNQRFYLVTASDRYEKNENGTFAYITDESAEEKLRENALSLKVVGIIRPKAGTENATITSAVAYTYMLTDYIITHTDSSNVVAAQQATPDINVLNGMKFTVPDDKEKINLTKEYIQNLSEEEKSSIYTFIKYYETFEKYNSTEKEASADDMTESEKAAAFDKWVADCDDEALLAIFNAFISNGNFPSEISGNAQATTESEKAESDKSLLGGLFSNRTGIKDTENQDSFFGRLVNCTTSFFKSLLGIEGDSASTSAFSSSVIGKIDDSTKLSLIKESLEKLSDSEKANFYDMLINYNLIDADAETIKSIVGMLNTSQGVSLQSGMMFNQSSVAALLDSWLENTPNDSILLKIYDQYIGYSTYEENMESFGKTSYDAPSSISIYTDSFDDKDAVALCISDYNQSVDESSQITYTDYISLITSSITTIIDTVSGVIIAFVAISLVVSSIMICVITHISVMERTKEIGILRALGASKKNISNVFNAETIIIGCFSGLLGIAVTMLLLIPINMVLNKVFNFDSLTANLTLTSSLGLILLSIVITFLGGLLPAKKAANKDPAIALRTD